jgi:predicted RNA-binding protein with RPS1 domain
MSEKQESISIGDVYAGKVLKIKPFGAIVSLPNSAPGLVHISQIANGFVQNVADVLAVGDEVNVRVLTMDEASGKISLSMKDVQQAYDEEAYDDEYADDEDDYDEDGNPRYSPQPVVISAAAAASFEEKFKSWQKISNERIAGINKRNKRR